MELEFGVSVLGRKKNRKIRRKSLGMGRESNNVQEPTTNSTHY